MKIVTTSIYLCVLSMTLTACMSPAANASYPFSLSANLQAGGEYSSGARSDKDELKMAALQGLLSAPTERALPLVRKVLNGNSSIDVKQKALFVLGQHSHQDAQSLLLNYAARPGVLQKEAIRVIGIGGEKTSLSRLQSIYAGADTSIKEAVLQAYLIADDKDAVFRIAQQAGSDEEFDIAVRVLGAMNARNELRKLFDRNGSREGLVQAYAIAGDLKSLSRMANEATNSKERLTAIRSIGIVGDQSAKNMLESLYRSANSDEIRDAALQGMIIADHDEGVLNLFKESRSVKQKRELMRTLVIMDSDLALDVIDSTLQGE